MKLKILNYHPLFLPSRGGTETHIYSFAEHSRHKHYVLTDMLPGTREHERLGACEVIRARPSQLMIPPKNVSLADMCLELPRELAKMLILKDIDHDLLHLRFGYLSPRLLIGLDNKIGMSHLTRLAAWHVSQKPILVTFHALRSQSDSGDFSIVPSRTKKSWRGIESYFCKYAKAIVCVDEFMIEPLRKMSEGKRIHFVPSGINTDMFRPLDRDYALSRLPSRVRNAIGETRFNVLTAIRIEPTKGSHLLQRLSKVLPDNVNLIIAGRAPENASIRWKNAKLIGELPNETIPYLINSCDIGINLTLVRGVGRFTFEAMACGKPVIRLLCGKGYPLADMKNVIFVRGVKDALSRVKELCRDESLRGEIGKGALQIRKSICVRTLAGAIDNIYEETLAG